MLTPIKGSTYNHTYASGIGLKAEIGNEKMKNEETRECM